MVGFVCTESEQTNERAFHTMTEVLDQVYRGL